MTTTIYGQGIGRGVTNLTSIFNSSTAQGANLDIISAPLTPQYPPCVFRLYAVMATAGVLNVRRIQAGTGVIESMNSGNSLVANSGYSFDIPVEASETINIQYTVGTTVLALKVTELDVQTG